MAKTIRKNIFSVIIVVLALLVLWTACDFFGDDNNDNNYNNENGSGSQPQLTAEEAMAYNAVSVAVSTIQGEVSQLVQQAITSNPSLAGSSGTRVINIEKEGRINISESGYSGTADYHYIWYTDYSVNHFHELNLNFSDYSLGDVAIYSGTYLSTTRYFRNGTMTDFFTGDFSASHLGVPYSISWEISSSNDGSTATQTGTYTVNGKTNNISY